jgi:hypothetical protein
MSDCGAFVNADVEREQGYETWSVPSERRMTHVMMRLTTVLLLLTVGTCERPGPPPKPIGSATNKHVEEKPAGPSRRDADAMIQNMKTPMEEAGQTEHRLKEAESRTRQQGEQTP